MFGRLKGWRGPWTYVYSVKYLCGTFDPFPNVVHWTEINVHNPSAQSQARMTKKFLVAGTQEHPTGPQARERLVLPPNGAFELDCNEIYEKLQLPVNVSTKGFVEIVSDRKLQVVAIHDKCTRQPHTDVFEHTIADVTVEFDLNLDGWFEIEVDMRLVGRTVVKKSDQRLNAAMDRFYIGTEIIDMNLVMQEVTGARLIEPGPEPGADPVVTPINPAEMPVDLTGLRLVQSPIYPTRGKITGPVNERLEHESGITSFFEVFVEADLPTDLKDLFGDLYNDEAVLMRADLTQVEPPGQPTEDGKNEYQSPRGPVPLISTAQGQTVAQIKAHLHTPTPPPEKQPPRRRHRIVPCETASIDVEYVEPVLRIARRREGATVE